MGPFGTEDLVSTPFLSKALDIHLDVAARGRASLLDSVSCLTAISMPPCFCTNLYIKSAVFLSLSCSLVTPAVSRSCFQLGLILLGCMHVIELGVGGVGGGGGGGGRRWEGRNRGGKLFNIPICSHVHI